MLTYVLAKDASGTATLVLTPKDSGGTANGGRDLASPGLWSSTWPRSTTPRS